MEAMHFFKKNIHMYNFKNYNLWRPVIAVHESSLADLLNSFCIWLCEILQCVYVFGCVVSIWGTYVL